MPSLRGGGAGGGAGGHAPFNDWLCSPPIWFIQNTFLEHHVTTRHQAIMEKGIITFKRDSRSTFSRIFSKLLANNCRYKNVTL